MNEELEQVISYLNKLFSLSFGHGFLEGMLQNGSGSRVSDLCLKKSRRVHPPNKVRKLVISMRYREITVKLLLRERYLRNAIWPRRLVVRTSALHADNTGSNPVGVTIDTETNQVLRFD